VHTGKIIAPDELEQKQRRDNVHRNAYAFGFPAKQLDKHPGENAEDQTLGDAIGERHHHNTQKCRKAFLKIGKIYRHYGFNHI